MVAPACVTFLLPVRELQRVTRRSPDADEVCYCDISTSTVMSGTATRDSSSPARGESAAILRNISQKISKSNSGWGITHKLSETLRLK